MKVVLENLSHSFGSTKVLDNINLTVDKGELFTLLGPSGCGKTTILRIISGFITPSEGRILVGDRDITHLSPEKRNIGMVFQNYALFPHMTVVENVKYGLVIKKLEKKVIDQKLDKYLDLVGMNEYRERKISQLSGGQQQRVAVARALAVEPELLLLDEPMSNLDAALRDRMRDEIRELQQKLGITTIFITHDQREALSISDRVAVMNEGNCIQIGTPFEVYNNPKTEFVATFVGESNISGHGFLEGIGCLRPEMVLLSSEDIFGKGLEGIVEKVSFNGSTIEYVIRVKAQRIKALELNDGSSIRALGDKVFVGLRGEY